MIDGGLHLWSFDNKLIKLIKILFNIFQSCKILFIQQVYNIGDTVNSEIFARTLFSRNFAYAKFRENKTLERWQNHSVVYWYRYNLPKSRIFHITNMSFDAIRENKILAKISESTVRDYFCNIRVKLRRRFSWIKEEDRTKSRCLQMSRGRLWDFGVA